MKSKSLRWRLVGAVSLIVLLFAALSYGLMITQFNAYYTDDIYHTLVTGHKTPEGRIAQLDQENRFELRNIIELNYILLEDGQVRRFKGPGTPRVPDLLVDTLTPYVEGAEVGTANHQFQLTVPVFGEDQEPGENPFGITDAGVYDIYAVITRSPVQYQTPNLSPDQDRALKMRIDNTLMQMGVKPNNRLLKGAPKVEIIHVSLKGIPLESDLQRNMFKQLGLGLLITGVFLVGLLFWISRRMISPLEALTTSVTQMKERKFSDPIAVQGEGEIGLLAEAIETMRVAIDRHEKEQQFKMHAISHELKTPIMVIKSYLDAVQNGVYPKGDLESSVQVALDESDRLERLVHELLNLQRIDYLAEDTSKLEMVDMTSLVEFVVLPHRTARGDLNVQVDLDKVQAYGNMELLKVVIENIMDNQVRYANSCVQVTLKEQGDKIILNFDNDGASVDHADTIFEPFKKSADGGFGLGLYIVKRIIDQHHGTIGLEQPEGLVRFHIELPAHQKKDKA